MDEIQKIIARLDAALKGITTTTVAGDAILEPAQFEKYIRLLQHQTSVLPIARLMVMTSHTQDIDRIGFTSRVMGVPGTEGQSKDEADFVSPTFEQRQLIAKEMQGIVSVTDSLVRRNVEKQGLMNTILDLMAERSGLDIEEQGINGDTDSSDEYLALNDGWLKQTRRRCVEDSLDRKDYDDDTTPLFETAVAETTQTLFYDDVPITPGTWQIYITSTSGTLHGHDDGNGVIVEDNSSGISGTIDYSSGKVVLAGLTAETEYFTKYTVKTFDLDASSGVLFPENMFNALIEAIPKPYYRRPNEWKICVPWWVLDAYHELLRARGTDLGDSWQQNAGVELPYKGLKIRYVPNMPNGKAWLMHPDNTIYGVFHEVEVENEREAKKKRTDVIVNAETDYGFEEPEATVVADIYE